MYDARCFEIGWDFVLAGEEYRNLNMEIIPSDQKTYMCGLFKQATLGDIDVKYKDRSGSVLDNCQAWEDFKGLSKPEAMREYIKKSKEIVEIYSAIGKNTTPN